MSAATLAKKYNSLTAEERFRLIMAAIGRGDEAEQDRLEHAGGHIVLKLPDHVPYIHAFNIVGLQVFLELLDAAAHFDDALERLADYEDWHEVEEKPERWKRYSDMLLAYGYMLRARVEGWKLFCERYGISPFQYLEKLPGFDHLKNALELAETRAFSPEDFLCWLNRRPREGESKLTEATLTAEGCADMNEKVFRELVSWWGG